MSSKRLAGTGIWSGNLRYGDAERAATLATELEQLGYSALWIPDVGGDVFTPLDNLLGATTSATIATGILNVWMHAPEETAAQHARLTAAHGNRFLCGLGISHRPLIDHVNEPGTYAKPIATMSTYLDGLDAAPTPLAPADRVIAALGPKMLELSAQRTLGALPYNVTPKHTALAAKILGPNKMLAVEQKVTIETDAAKARALGRKELARYMVLENYRNNWLREGFTEADLADGGSDKFIDAMCLWGDADTVRRGLRAHFDAGATHVCLQPVHEDGNMAARDKIIETLADV